MTLRHLWVFLIACAAYCLCLRFAFPGYFAPTAPFHLDLFDGQGFQAWPNFWLTALTLPRPAGFLAIRALDELGLAGSLVAIALVTILNVVLLVRLIGGVPLQNFALYTLVLFAQPQFYFNHRHDTLQILSCCYLLLGLTAWQQYLLTEQRRYLALWIASAFLLCFTKETYFLAGLLFAASNILLSPPKHRRTALILTGIFAVLMVAAFLNNTHANTPFITTKNDPHSPYYVSLAPISVAEGFWFYLTKQWTWASLALVALAFATTKDRLRPALFVLAGLSTLAVHAVLPNHLDLEYAWVGALLTFSPILFLPAKPITYAAAVPLLGLCLWLNQPGYKSQNWNVEQEQMNRRTLATFNTIHHFLQSGDSVVVTGLTSPFQPFLVPKYLETVFGPGITWQVAVPRDRPGSHLPDIIHHNSSLHTKFLAYDEQGSLQNHGPLTPDTQLLAGIKPGTDFYTLLKNGALYWTWGLTEQARTTLERAQAAEPKNGYPSYYLGQIAEQADHNLPAARRYYEQAIKADQPTPNPVFTEAFQRVRDAKLVKQ